MEKVIFDYKDLGLASYLMANGNELKGFKLKYSTKFNEFKIYAQIEGVKSQLIIMKDFYEENKKYILKTKTVIDNINYIATQLRLE